MAVLILAGALGATAFAFVGYPVAIALLARFAGRPHRTDESVLPRVTVIVAARNEALVIGAKVDDIAGLDYPADRLDAVLVSDGSTDRTDEIIRDRVAAAGAGGRFRLLRQDPSQGKAAALGRALGHATGDVVVFTDANVLFDRAAVRRLVRHFADARVGAVTGTVKLVDDKAGYAPSEGLYYRYEWLIQRAESEFESVVGVDGALYAVRRDLVKAPPPDTLLDDFAISMDVAARGWRIIYDPEATAIEDAAPTIAQELRRKARVALGAFQALGRAQAIPTPRTPRLLFSYIGHKLLRWVAPWALLATFLASAALAPASGLAAAFLAVQAVLYALAAAGIVFPQTRSTKAVAVPMYFVLMNAAFAWGLLKYVGGQTQGGWTPVERRALATPVAGVAAKPAEAA